MIDNLDFVEQCYAQTINEDDTAIIVHNIFRSKSITGHDIT